MLWRKLLVAREESVVDCDSYDILGASDEWIKSTIECKGWSINTTHENDFLYNGSNMRWAGLGTTGGVISLIINNAPAGDYTIAVTGTRYGGSSAGTYFSARLNDDGITYEGARITPLTNGDLGTSTITRTVAGGSTVIMSVASEQQGSGRNQFNTVEITVPAGA